jgi:uncharacterized protein YdhG (YjbR/CyaY superfamily)
LENNKYTPGSIDEYIASFPKEIQEKLNELRYAIKSVAPEASEKISWQMPTFVLNGNLVHFAAFKKHIGFYPGSNAIITFEKDLSEYNYSKGAIQFPIDKILPIGLVKRIVKFRVKENIQNKKG